MDLFHNLYIGFSIALTWVNLLYCGVGVLVGTLVLVGTFVLVGTGVLVGEPRRLSGV